MPFASDKYDDHILATRVARGARHLDCVAPGWFDEVSVVTLNQSNAGFWVAAQVAGTSYGDACYELNLRAPGFVSGGFAAPTTISTVEDYYSGGFAAPTTISTVEDYYSKLTQHWKAVIKQRRSSRKYNPEQATQTEEI